MDKSYSCHVCIQKKALLCNKPREREREKKEKRKGKEKLQLSGQ